jgi:hypothetical protein
MPKKISELPLYSDNKSDELKAVWVVLEKQERGQLEQGISSLRQETEGLIQKFHKQRQELCQYVTNTRSSVNSQLNSLRNEHHILPKLAFISLSGLSGLLIGYRRSTFRKLVYSTVLGGGAVALCYPKEARVYSTQVYDVASKNAYALYRQYVWPDEAETKAKAKKAAESSGVEQSGNAKDKVVKLDNEAIRSAKTSKEIKGDKGQSSDADKDMYTTRK